MAIFVLGLIILELCFGNWFSDANFGDLHIPRDISRQYKVDGLYPGPEYVTFTKDSNGFRGDYLSPDRIGILTMGGSTTEQTYIDDSATWQKVMAERFRGEGLDINVVNAGIDGQSTYGHLKNFEWWFPGIEGFSPKCILFYVGINDVFLDAPPVNERWWLTMLAEKSILYKVFGMVKGLVLSRRYDVGHGNINLAVAEWTDRPLADKSKRQDVFGPNIRRYEERLIRLFELTRSLGAMPLAVTQKTRWAKVDQGRVYGVDRELTYGGVTFNLLDMHYVLGMFNEATRRVCREMKVPCLDLEAGLEFDDADFYDYLHNTPSGARKVGVFLAEQILASPGVMGALDSPPQ